MSRRVLEIGGALAALLMLAIPPVAAQAPAPTPTPAPPKASSPAPAASPAPAGGLEYRWTKGDVLRYRMVRDVRTKVTGAQQAEINQTATVVWTQEVKDVGADGVATIETRYASAGLVFDFPAKSWHLAYDSANPDTAKYAGSFLVVPYANLPGESFTAKVDKHGKILSVDGFDKITDKVVQAMKATPQNAAYAEQSRTTLGGLMRAQLENAFRPVYAKAPKTGEVWKVDEQEKDPQVGTIQSELAYTLASFEPLNGQDCAKIDFVATIKVEPPAGAAAAPQAKVTDSKDSGSFFFAKDKGYLIKGETTSSQDVEAVIGAPPAAGGPAPTVVQHQETHVALELQPAEAAPAPAQS